MSAIRQKLAAANCIADSFGRETAYKQLVQDELQQASSELLDQWRGILADDIQNGSSNFDIMKGLLMLAAIDEEIRARSVG